MIRDLQVYATVGNFDFLESNELRKSGWKSGMRH